MLGVADGDPFSMVGTEQWLVGNGAFVVLVKSVEEVLQVSIIIATNSTSVMIHHAHSRPALSH